MNPVMSEVVNESTLPPRQVAVTLSCERQFSELNRLVRTLEAGDDLTSHRIIQFISAYHREEASDIAFETAIICQLLNKKVLFIETTPPTHVAAKVLSAAVKFPLNTIISKSKTFNEVIVSADRTNLHYTAIKTSGEHAITLNDMNSIEKLIVSFKPLYDIIILDGVNIMNNTLGLTLAKSVDGTILVIEAENTRVPVALKVKELIEESGGKVVGAILNKRRFYIPKFLYRWLYH